MINIPDRNKTPPTQEIEAKEQNMSDKATNTETTPKEELVANNKEAYAIDLGSFEQIGDIRLGTLNGLGDLFTNPRNHVMIGIYEEEDEAAENLNVVKKNGFKYATITSEVAASIFKNQSKTTTPASPAKKTMAPPEPKPEAVFTPAKPKDTTPTQPAPSAKKATNTEQTAPKPENYGTNTTAKAAAIVTQV